MRPFHEIMRLVGLEDGADIPEPRHADPLELVKIGEYMRSSGLTPEGTERGLEVLCREENIKPAVLMAALHDLRVREYGMRLDSLDRRLTFSGKVGRDGSIVFKAWPSWHPSMGEEE